MQRSNNHSHIKSSSNPRALRSDSPLSLVNTKKKTLPLHRQGRACSSTNVALPASMALRTRLRYARPHGRRVVQHRPAQLSPHKSNLSHSLLLLTGSAPNPFKLILAASPSLSAACVSSRSPYPVALLMGTGTAATPSLPAARGPSRSPDPAVRRFLPRSLRHVAPSSRGIQHSGFYLASSWRWRPWR